MKRRLTLKQRRINKERKEALVQIAVALAFITPYILYRLIGG